MDRQVFAARVDREQLRLQIQSKYTDVAREPEMGFHFHTGYPLTRMLRYPEAEVGRLPAETVASFAGTGNPFSMGGLNAGEVVLDLGCGAGLDTLIAGQQVGPEGHVYAVDMTASMLERTTAGAESMGLTNVTARQAYAESVPLAEASVDVVISNGVINLTPDKEAVMREVWRVLKPGGRIQIADIVVHKEVDQSAKDDIDLWSG